MDNNTNNVDDMISVLKEYNGFIRPYQDAINEVRIRLEALDKDFMIKHHHNPIHRIQHRVKSLDSIVKKLNKRGYPSDLEYAKEYLTDISGIRVICYYEHDVYTVAKALKKWKDLVVVKENDYIEHPKKNGYRSYHMIIVVPIHYIDCTEYYPVEIQLRTLTMDTWASIEHQIYYKQTEYEKQNNDQLSKELKEQADHLHKIGKRMETLYLTHFGEKDDCEKEELILNKSVQNEVPQNTEKAALEEEPENVPLSEPVLTK